MNGHVNITKIKDVPNAANNSCSPSAAYSGDAVTRFAASPLPTAAAASRIATIPPTLNAVMKSLKPVPERTARMWIHTSNHTMATAQTSTIPIRPRSRRSSESTGKKLPR